MFESFFNGISPAVGITLICASTLTSLMTASLGAGGGVMLLGLMAQILPPQLIIPLHGVVQLGSNAGRATLSFKHIDWKLIGLFLVGAVVGSVIGRFVLVGLPPAVMYLTIAAFILYLSWGPQLPKLALGKSGTVAAGGVTTFLSLFVGASGPIVAAFIKQVHSDRFKTVATFAAAMSLQHIFKALVFQNAGFNLIPWLPLLLAMICSGAVGTFIGLKLLRRMSDRNFGRIFKMVLSLMALRLIWQAVASLI